MRPSEESVEAKQRKPSGLKILELIRRRRLTRQSCQGIVLVLTFLSYTCYHANRKIASVVKSVLDPNPSSNSLFSPHRDGRFAASLTDGWAPFDGADGTELLGILDVSFLAVYAIGMYFSGHFGDRMDLRIFLTVGMFGTAFFTSMFGIGYWMNIHNFYFFLVMQMLAGLFQSTGWPSVVAVVGNWFGKSKRGLIMGIWNAHTSVGNIAGSLIASALLTYGWGWSFVVPSILMAAVASMIYFFLPASPSGFDFQRDEEDDLQKVAEPLLPSVDDRPVGFMEAWRIPGVASFALCLFFAKLVAYTFLYWLPFYISHTEIGGEYLSSTKAGNLSTLFDVGGVLGGILAGHISDRLDARAVTAASFMYLAIPALYFYRSYGESSLPINICLMFVTGMMVNGPYALITTAVSADLGTHNSLKGNSKALATVTAIIDGTGSLGAAIGPLLTGYISAKSWSAVFTMLMAAAFVAGLLLTRLVVDEVAVIMSKSRSRNGSVSDGEV